jgi:hypothetical protein
MVYDMRYWLERDSNLPNCIREIGYLKKTAKKTFNLFGFLHDQIFRLLWTESK